MTDQKKLEEETGFTANQLNVLSVYLDRMKYASRLGKTHSGNRDLYKECGYPTTLKFSDYKQRYERQGLAKRIVRIFPDATWRNLPTVYENVGESETAFEKDWNALLKSVRVYHYLKRIDRISGIGRFGILVIGFDDTEKLEKPVKNASSVVFLQPYDEGSVSIASTVKDIKDPRYALPETYKIITDAEKNETMTVHWTRVIHVAEDLDDSDVYGTPRMKDVYNNLQDIEMLTGGSAEMFWQGAFPGWNFKADKDAIIGEQDKTALEEQIEGFVNGLSRYMRLKGIDAQMLKGEVSDPGGHVKVQMQMLAGAKGIPLRILTGSERGELASTMDTATFNASVEERREGFAEPMILRAFIDRCISVGVLSVPVNGYKVVWPDLATPSDKEKAEVVRILTEAIAKYIESGVDVLIPPFQFLTMFLELDADVANDILRSAEAFLSDESEVVIEPSTEKIKPIQ